MRKEAFRATKEFIEQLNFYNKLPNRLSDDEKVKETLKHIGMDMMTVDSQFCYVRDRYDKTKVYETTLYTGMITPPKGTSGLFSDVQVLLPEDALEYKSKRDISSFDDTTVDTSDIEDLVAQHKQDKYETQKRTRKVRTRKFKVTDVDDFIDKRLNG